MKRFCDEDRWENIYLFSLQGLLMAGYESTRVYHEENLLEFVFSLIETNRMLETDISVKEITILGKKKKILLFTYFEALGEELVLTTVTSGKKRYRRALNNLIKFIKSLNA